MSASAFAWIKWMARIDALCKFMQYSTIYKYLPYLFTICHLRRNVRIRAAEKVVIACWAPADCHYGPVKAGGRGGGVCYLISCLASMMTIVMLFIYCNLRGQCILFSVVSTPSSPSCHSSVWVLPVISLLLTNTVSPVRACLIM